MTKWLLGVDEAGRGPLAGPVAVGIVMAAKNYDISKNFPGVNDSKQLSEAKREEIYNLLLQKVKAGDIKFCVRFSSHIYIDKFGITKAVRRALWSGAKALAPNPTGVHIKLDGLLKAPSAYKQQTIVRGDATVPIISLASIAAKVERDRLMRRMAKKYSEYGFDQHKGYGTAAHYAAIGEFGLSDIHRRSFCKSVEKSD